MDFLPTSFFRFLLGFIVIITVSITTMSVVGYYLPSGEETPASVYIAAEGTVLPQ